jgi:RimJ/RimL family protein N-acetyltransferase
MPLSDALEVRPVDPADRPRVTAVADEWWGRPVPGLLPRPFFSEFRDTSFLVELDGELVAFLVGFLSQSNPDDAYIHAVAVAPAWRGRGLAASLYERFIAVARRHGRRRIRAVTSPVNATSIAFHERLRFAVALPSEAEADDGCVRFLLELQQPKSVDFESASPFEAAAALRTPLAGTLIALEPLDRRHGHDLAQAAAASDWRLMPLDASAPEPFARWFESMLAADPRAAFAVICRRNGRAIGSTSFHAIYPEHRRVEIGMTWYARSEWGSGANVEAKLLMLERAFELGFRRVEFKTDARNLRSRRALEALPAKFEGVMRKHMVVRDGERRDSAYYSVIDDDWPAVRANLERRLEQHHRQRNDHREGDRAG